MPDRFRLLTVCTANICRSPLAEQLLADALEGIPPMQVSSAGTHALVGEAMNETSQHIARELGVPHPERHVARQLTAELLTDSDLVLALTREHRRLIVELSPRVARRVFTIREFGRLADALEDQDLRAEMGHGPVPLIDRLRIAAASVVLARTGLNPARDPEDDDVVDPFARGAEIFRQSTQQLAPAVEATARLFRRAAALPPLAVR